MSVAQLSVVIPVRDGADLLGEALESVLRQTRSCDEVVVVDDGSSDATAQVATAFAPRVRVVASPRRGPAAARNAGIAATTGAYLAFLDHDDVWREGKLDVQQGLLARSPGTGLVLGLTQIVARRHAAGEFLPHGAPYAAISFGAALVRRTVFAALGPLDEARRFGEDVEWFARAGAARVRVAVHHDVVQLYRRHGKNLTDDTARTRTGFFDALRSVARERAATERTEGAR